MRTGCDFRNGFVGGESGFSAASSRRCCDEVSSRVEREVVVVDEDDEGEGERRKVRKPNASKAARMRVMGLVRRIGRATAIMPFIRF